MFIAHGWLHVNIIDFWRFEDEFYSKLKSFEHRYNSNKNFIFSYQGINGDFAINFSMFSNHVRVYWDEILNLTRYIAEKSKGSYGVIYFQDNEDDENWDQFLVYVLAKGTLSIQKDAYLSPISLKLEDPDDEG